MINKEMSYQDSDKVPIPFHDFAACFSEEEWKLSHEWQKEIYRNVMKEFHRALISLGYTIHGTLLRMNDGGEMHIRGAKDSERRADPSDPTSSCYADVNPDILFRIKHEEEQDFMDQHASEETEIMNSPSTGDQFDIKAEEESLSADKLGSESQEIITSPTGDPDVLFGIKGYENHHLKDPHDRDRRERSDYLSTVVQFSFNEGRQHHLMDHQGSDRRDIIGIPTGDGSMNRKRNFGNSVKFIAKSAPCKSMTRNVKAKVIPSVDERTHPISQMWPGGDQEPRGEKSTQWQSDCNQPTHSSLHQSIPYVQIPDTSNGCESTARNVHDLPCESNTMKNWSLLPCAESEQTFCKNKSPIRHQRPHAEKGRYTYTQCEKSFSAVSKLRHERAERPYLCTICGKSFNNNGVLIIHQRIHTGERPYQCNVCGTSFNQKGVLFRHQQIHTGERPYQCNLCEKSFSRKGSLIRHQTIHKKGWTALES